MIAYGLIAALGLSLLIYLVRLRLNAPRRADLRRYRREERAYARKMATKAKFAEKRIRRGYEQ